MYHVQYLKHYWQCRQVQGCGNSNYGRVILFSILSVECEKVTEEIGYKYFTFLFVWAYVSFLYHHRKEIFSFHGTSEIEEQKLAVTIDEQP